MASARSQAEPVGRVSTALLFAKASSPPARADNDRGAEASSLSLCVSLCVSLCLSVRSANGERQTTGLARGVRCERERR